MPKLLLIGPAGLAGAPGRYWLTLAAARRYGGAG